MMWLTLILRQWQVVVILLLSCALGASMLHGRYLSAKLDVKTAEISAMRIVAQSYADQSVITAKETSDAFTTLVDKIERQNIALENAKKRFSSCNVAGGIRLPTQPSDGQTNSTSGPDAASEERLVVDRPFIDACALDAGTVTLWQQWAMSNALPISKE